MMQAAKQRIRRKVANEGWAGGISFCWLERLAGIKRAWCNGICRFAILRWAVNQDDDVWLSTRGSRHNQPCQGCQNPTDIYPYGFWQSPRCEACIQRRSITPDSFYPDVDPLFGLYQNTGEDPLPLSIRSQQTVGSLQHSEATNNSENYAAVQSILRDHLKEQLPTHDSVCRACGIGDDAVGHCVWSHFFVSVSFLRFLHDQSASTGWLARVTEQLLYALWCLLSFAGYYDRKVHSYTSRHPSQSRLLGG